MNKLSGPRCLARPADSLSVVMLVIEAMLFGLFTSCMLLDQWGAVATGRTQIDRLKGEEGGKGRHGFNEVFGGERGFTMDWLIPR